MRRSDFTTVRPVAPGPVRQRWYRSLAYAVAATAGPSGAMFESTNREPVPRVTVRPRSLVETLRAAPPCRAVGLDALDGASVQEPPAGWVSRIRYVTSFAGSLSTTTFRSTVGRDLPDLTARLGPTAWLALQTHWIRGRTGALWVTRRFRLAAATEEELTARIDGVATAVAEDWSVRVEVGATTAPSGRGARRDWRRGTVRAVPADAWLLRPTDRVADSAEASFAPDGRSAPAEDGHAVVFGASGAGKTTYLARLAVRQVAAGRSVVVIDLHGDLAPRVVSELPERFRPRVVAVDASARPVAGIAALTGPGASAELAAAHFVAAVKRLTPDGTEVYWGFRLERVFDAFVRLAQESGGSLLDVFELLTDAARRDAARLATRRAELAQFLDELGPIVRRQPDFLWSAATRLSKVVVVPALAELLAPVDEGLPVEELVERGRPVLVRLPFATLGPEAAGFAGSLVLARVYLGLAARRSGRTERPDVYLLLDEAHGFSPRLVTELLTESRKFGLRVVLATQYPDRFGPEVRAAAAGALAGFTTFRVPPAVAGTVGGWVGLPRDAAEHWLPGLPVGYGVRLDPTTGAPRTILPEGPVRCEDLRLWSDAVRRTREEFHVPPTPPERLRTETGATERLLLAVLAAEEARDPLPASQVLAAATALPGSAPPREVLGDRWPELLRQGLVVVTDDGCRLSEAGARRLGLTSETGATRESSEHRALLLATFRLFARRGYRIEVVRQGRFDTTLPDAVFRQLAHPGARSPAELAREIDRVRNGWAWRCFGGRDVHIEVEVSGALRPERVRRGWRKAADRGAFALFVVGDARRARRVRTTLRALGLGPDRAQVWTVRLPGGPEANPARPERPNP